MRILISRKLNLWGIPTSFVVPIMAAVAAIGIGYLLAGIGPANPVIVGHGENPTLLWSNAGVYPEPLDRFLFISLTLTVPFVLLCTVLVAKKIGAEPYDPKAIFWVMLCFILAICFEKSTFTELARILKDWQWPITLACVLFSWSLVMIPERIRQNANQLTLLLSVVMSLVMIATQRIWVLNSIVYDGGHFTSHYEAVTSALVRIAGGQTCLVEVIPQYGCYGEFLAPLLKYFGSTVLNVTIIFTILQIAAISSVLFFVRALFSRTAILTGCLFSVMIAAALNLVYDNPDPVLQYFPLRFLFPSLSLLLVLWFQRAPNILRSISLGVFSGASLAWNLESGVAVTVSIAIFIVAGNFTAHPWEKRSEIILSAQRFVAFFVAATLFIALFLFYLYTKSSSTLDIAKYFLYQNMFYVTGFGMIPMPSFPDYWTIHCAIVFFTLILAALWTASRKRDRDPNLELATYVAVLAIGLFAYYTGRSHLLVLRLVAWPSVILFFFLLDRASDYTVSRLGHYLIFGITIFSCALPIAFLLKASPSVVQLATTVRNAPTAKNALVRDDISFITSHTSPGEVVAIIALNQSVLYGEAAVRPALDGPGVAEMVRRIDRDDQVRMLLKRGPEKLFLGTNISQAAKLGTLGTNLEISAFHFQPAYVLDTIGPGERLLLLKRKPFSGEDLIDIQQ